MNRWLSFPQMLLHRQTASNQGYLVEKDLGW